MENGNRIFHDVTTDKIHLEDSAANLNSNTSLNSELNPPETFANISLQSTDINTGSLPTNTDITERNVSDSADGTTATALSNNLIIFQQLNDTPSQAGDILTYAIIVTEQSPEDHSLSDIENTILSDLSKIEYSVDNGTTWRKWDSFTPLLALAKDSSNPPLVRGTVPFLDPESTEGDTHDLIDAPTLESSIDTQATAVDSSADLSVTKLCDTNPIMAGEVLTYRLTVTNNGPDDAQDVILTDNISSDLTDVSYSIDNGTTWEPWANSYDLGTIPNTDYIYMLIRGTVSSSAAETLTNTATVSSSTVDPDTTNNSYTETTTVITSADLAISLISTPIAVNIGETLSYIILVDNYGPQTAQNVVITDTLPSSLTDVEYSIDGGILWQPWDGSFALGALAPNETSVILIHGVLSQITSDSLSNTASVSSTSIDPNENNNSSTVITSFQDFTDLSITQTVQPEVILPCGTATYTFFISNDGPNTAYDVILTDVLPKEICLAQYSIDNGQSWIEWNGTLSFGDLAAGTKLTLLLNVKFTNRANGVITNSVHLTSATPELNPENNHSEVTIRIQHLCNNCMKKLNI